VEPGSVVIDDRHRIQYRHLVLAGDAPGPYTVNSQLSRDDDLVVTGGDYRAILTALSAAASGSKVTLLPGPSGLLPREFHKGLIDYTGRVVLGLALENSGVTVCQSPQQFLASHITDNIAKLTSSASGGSIVRYSQRLPRHLRQVLDAPPEKVSVFDYLSYDFLPLSIDFATFTHIAIDLAAHIADKPQRVLAYQRMRLAGDQFDLLIASSLSNGIAKRTGTSSYRITDLSQPMHHHFRFADRHLGTVLQVGHGIDVEPVLRALDAQGFCDDPGSLVCNQESPVYRANARSSSSDVEMKV
jgi:hypothetical protein